MQIRFDASHFSGNVSRMISLPILVEYAMCMYGVRVGLFPNWPTRYMPQKTQRRFAIEEILLAESGRKVWLILRTIGGGSEVDDGSRASQNQKRIH